MNYLYHDRMLLEETEQYLDDLRETGQYDVTQMAQSLQSVFFTEDWETFLILQNWIATGHLKKERENR